MSDENDETLIIRLASAITARMRRENNAGARRLAENGHYWLKVGSKFDERDGYLPLDLWDSTPDP